MHLHLAGDPHVKRPFLKLDLCDAVVFLGTQKTFTQDRYKAEWCYAYNKKIPIIVFLERAVAVPDDWPPPTLIHRFEPTEEGKRWLAENLLPFYRQLERNEFYAFIRK